MGRVPVTVSELIEKLEACDPEQEIMIFDGALGEEFELGQVYIDMDPDAVLLAFFNFKE